MNYTLNYNINYEVATVILLLIILVMYKAKNKFMLQQNILYFRLVSVFFIASLLNILSHIAYLNQDHINTTILYILYIATYIFSILAPLTYFLYTLSMCDLLYYFKKIKYQLLLVPAIVGILLTIVTPFFKTIFYITENGKIKLMSSSQIITYIFLIYMLFSLITLILHHNKITLKNFSILMFFIVSYTLSMFIQIKVFDNRLYITYFSSSIIIFIIYMLIHNPDYFIDSSNGQLNTEALKLTFNEAVDSGIPFGVISIQLDEYKTLGEVYGMDGGDIIINEVGSFLRQSFPQASVFSLTNFQFIIIDRYEPNFNEYERIISDRFSKKWSIGGHKISLNKSICCLTYPEFNGNLDDMLSVLKFALQEAFNTNSMIIVGEFIINKLNHNIAVERAVEKAIENNTIQVYYQPIYSSKDRRITTCEALARLIDDELGFIPPDEFIRIAEENGSILQLGKQIFEKICVFIRNTDIKSLGIQYIEVNLSPIQCMQRELATELIAIADSYGLPMSDFNLEITESATTESKDNILINMERLCDKKATFSLDDYGTGFSNLTAIMDLPFNYVKIDKSIVWSYFDNTNTILKHLVEMFKKENLLIICEGVETKEQNDKLIEMGCDYIQGFYYSKPIPGEEFLNYLK